MNRAVSVVLPTYNERDNIESVLRRVDATFQAGQLDGEIVVVDDDSPDGTADAIHALKLSVPIRVFVRKNERGLSTAIFDGIGLARSEVFVFMDADLSHEPETIPAMTEPLFADLADMVIGSRFVEGGSVEDWPWYRHVISTVASWPARMLTRVTDPLAGFVAGRKSMLEGIQFRPLGYKVALEMLVRCDTARIQEVPIQFRNRDQGQSKLSLRVQGAYLWHLQRLFKHRMK
jgi:dolichol-phosphate mannosyltransferase